MLAGYPVEPVGLTSNQAEALIMMLLHDKGYTQAQIQDADIERTTSGPEDFPFAPGYYSFHVSYDSPDLQAVSTWGNFLVNRSNGDIYEMDNCTPYRFADLESIQSRIRAITKAKRLSYEDVQDQLGCM